MLEGSAIGLVFLAFIPELKQRVLSLRPSAFEEVPGDVDADIQTVRELGYALDLQQADAEHSCVAVPVFDSGRVRACIGLRGPAENLPRQHLIELAWMMTRLVNEHQPRRPAPVWWPLAS